MVTSKRMLLGVALLLTHVHLHTAEAELAYFILNELRVNTISNERREFVGKLENTQAEIRERIKDEPNGSNKRKNGLYTIELCDAAKHKLWEEIDLANGLVLP